VVELGTYRSYRYVLPIGSRAVKLEIGFSRKCPYPFRRLSTFRLPMEVEIPCRNKAKPNDLKMESCLILPNERPPSLLEIKRALLTYETVTMPSSEDRDIIPSNCFHVAVSPVPTPFAVPVGNVRPLGKVSGFDDYFSKVTDECLPAQKQGIVKILGTPGQSDQVTIGPIQYDKSWPDPVRVYRIYRAMASHPDFITSISRGLDDLALQSLDDLEALAPKGADDGGTNIRINGQEAPSLPPQQPYQGFVTSEEELTIYSRLCLARLGSLVKNLIRCQKLGLVPFTEDIGMASTAQLVSRNASAAMGEVSKSIAADEDYTRRIQIFDRLISSEYIPDDVLNRLSLDDVIKLRTKSWGENSIARNHLTEKIKTFSLESKNDEEFHSLCKKALEEYQKSQAKLQSEFAQYRIRLYCDLGITAVGIPAGYEILNKVIQVGDFGALLMAGGVFFKAVQGNIPILQKILDESKATGRLPGYTLARPYRAFLKH
jgi:hypothetical protein